VVASKLSTDLTGFIGETEVMKKKSINGSGFKTPSELMAKEKKSKLQQL